MAAREGELTQDPARRQRGLRLDQQQKTLVEQLVLDPLGEVAPGASAKASRNTANRASDRAWKTALASSTPSAWL
jgi:hypothetical protein